MAASHHSFFYRPDALPVAQPTSTKHWRHATLYTTTFPVYSLLTTSTLYWIITNASATDTTWPSYSLLHNLLPFPLTITLVLFIFTLMPLFSTLFFHSLSLLIRSPSLSAITTCAYNNSRGKSTLNSLHKAFMTITLLQLLPFYGLLDCVRDYPDEPLPER